MHKAEQNAHTVVQCVHCCGKARTLEISGVPRTWMYDCGRASNCRTSANLYTHEPTSPSSLGDAALQPPAIMSPQPLHTTLSIKGSTVVRLNCGQNWMIAVVLITELFSGWSHLLLCVALHCRGQYVQPGAKVCGPYPQRKRWISLWPIDAAFKREGTIKFLCPRMLVCHSVSGGAHWTRQNPLCFRIACSPETFVPDPQVIAWPLASAKRHFCVCHWFHTACVIRMHYDSSQVTLFSLRFLSYFDRLCWHDALLKTCCKSLTACVVIISFEDEFQWCSFAFKLWYWKWPTPWTVHSVYYYCQIVALQSHCRCNHEILFVCAVLPW